MNTMKLIGLNIKWYRYQNNWTQETFAEKAGFKTAYISTIETGNANLTCFSIDVIADTFNIKPILLFDEETAKLASKLPNRIDKSKNYKHNKSAILK